MKNCPVCGIGMLRVKYEGLSAFKCDRCKGYLLEASRLKGIARNRQTSTKKLVEEASREYHRDSQKPVECPKCRGTMKKTMTPPPAEIYVDSCDRCRLVWLDGGELAILQMQHEMSRKGELEENLRKRAANVTGARKAEFEANLAKLPEGEETADLLGLFGRAIVEGLTTSRWRRFENLFE